jgi:hypothetical protein
MTDAESLTVLNTLTKHNFQDVFKKMVEVPGTVHKRRRGIFWGWWWPIGPKLVFDQMAALALEIMEGSLYYLIIKVDS